jgi:hypothetical protein
MRRSAPIIAAIALYSLVSVPSSANAPEDASIAGYAAYHVRLEVARNRIHMGAPEQTMSAGQSATAEVDMGRRSPPLLVNQRVTRFPGAGEKMAILELEFFRLEGDEPRRLVAPTLGVELGKAEVYEVATAQGLITVRATVEGLDPVIGGGSEGPSTNPYPTL